MTIYIDIKVTNSMPVVQMNTASRLVSHTTMLHSVAVENNWNFISVLSSVLFEGYSVSSSIEFL